MINSELLEKLWLQMSWNTESNSDESHVVLQWLDRFLRSRQSWCFRSQARSNDTHTRGRKWVRLTRSSWLGPGSSQTARPSRPSGPEFWLALHTATHTHTHMRHNSQKHRNISMCPQQLKQWRSVIRKKQDVDSLALTHHVVFEVLELVSVEREPPLLPVLFRQEVSLCVINKAKIKPPAAVPVGHDCNSLLTPFASSEGVFVRESLVVSWSEQLSTQLDSHKVAKTHVYMYTHTFQCKMCFSFLTRQNISFSISF